MTISTARLVQRFQEIMRERMQGLPLVNDKLEVEAIGFDLIGDHAVGVLITPWFMNLVLLPGTDEWDGIAQGSLVQVDLPCDGCEFIVNRDEKVGVYLSAILFRTVKNFPDQAMARAIAEEIVASLHADAAQKNSPATRMVSRRSLIAGMGQA